MAQGRVGRFSNNRLVCTFLNLCDMIKYLPPAALFREKISIRHDFDFIDAPFPSKPGAGVDLYYPGPYYTWWKEANSSNIHTACKKLQSHFDTHGPYDGVLSFSRGCLLSSSFILFHQTENPTLPLPFKFCIFLCGGLAFPVLETLGIEVSPEATTLDKRTKIALRERASTRAIRQWGKARWTTLCGNGDDEPLGFDPDAPIDKSIVFGLDFTNLPRNMRITIPTGHVYGKLDPRFPASMQLASLCEPNVRFIFDHGSGHATPRDEDASVGIAKLVDCVAGGVQSDQEANGAEECVGMDAGEERDGVDEGVVEEEGRTVSEEEGAGRGPVAALDASAPGEVESFET